MTRPTSPLKAWLILSVLVLLAHLTLLQTLPLSLVDVISPTAVMAFSTRSLSPDSMAAKTPQPIRQPKPRPTRPPMTSPEHSVAPALPPMPVPEPSLAAESATSLESANQVVVAVAQSAPQEAASAPVPSDARATPAPPPVPETATRFEMEALPGSVKLNYQVQSNKFPYSLKSELIWRLEDLTYQASLSFRAFGQSRRQTSRGQIGTTGLLPERFSDKYRSEVAAHFNWTQGRVTFSANTPDASLQQGAQDRLSVLIQLAALAAGAPKQFSPGATVSIQTVGPREASPWLFTIGDLETLNLTGGTLQGLKLTKKSYEAYGQQVDIWLAPSLSYLPARIRITESNGDYMDQQWESSETVSPEN